MKKLIYLSFLLTLLTSCKKDEKCGEITNKVEVNGRYYFILDPESSINVAPSDDIASYIPDNQVSGEVIQAVYNQFRIGERYCQ